MFPKIDYRDEDNNKVKCMTLMHTHDDELCSHRSSQIPSTANNFLSGLHPCVRLAVQASVKYLL